MFRTKETPYRRKIRCSFWLVLSFFVLLGYSLQSVAGTIYYSDVTRTFGTVTLPPVFLQAGNASSPPPVIYANNTSAKVTTAAPANYNYVLKVVNSVSDPWKIRLKAYLESNIGRLNNCTIYFTNGTSRQIYIKTGLYVNQTGPWHDLPASPAEIHIAIALDASDSEVSYLHVYLEILVPDKTTYSQYVVTFEIT